MISNTYKISRWFDGLADFAVHGPGTTSSGHLLEHSQCIPMAIKYRGIVSEKVAPELTLAVSKLDSVGRYYLLVPL